MVKRSTPTPRFRILFLLHALLLTAAGCTTAPQSQDVSTQVHAETHPVVDKPSADGAHDKFTAIWARLRVSEITDDTGRTISLISAARAFHRSADTTITRQLDALCGELDHAGFWTAVDDWLADPKICQRVMGEGDSVTSPALQPRDLLEIATVAAWRFHRHSLPTRTEPTTSTAGFLRAWQLLGLAVHEPNVVTFLGAKHSTVLFVLQGVRAEATTPSDSRVVREIIDALDSYPWPLLDIDTQMIAKHKVEMLAEIDHGAHPHAAEVASRYFDGLATAITMPEPHRWRRIYQLADDAPSPKVTGVPDATYLSAGVFANRRLPAALAQLLRHVLATRHSENLTGRLPQSLDDLRAASAESRWMNRATGPGLVSLIAAPDGQAITLSIDGIVDPDEGRRVDLATAEDRDLTRDADIRITVQRSASPH